MMMKAIELEQTSQNLELAIEGLKVVKKRIPQPKPGQVLIKIEAAPCNPSDLLFLQGKYGVRKPLPTVPGWEGAGTVIRSGGGLLGWYLTGKRVACAGQTQGDGTWAEYYVTEAKNCIPLKEGVSMDQASTLIINPLTAVGMVEQAVAEKHQGIIQTAACSQVGRMVQTLARRNRIPVINIVRSQKQVDELESQGEDWVLNSTDPEFSRELAEYSKQLRATVAFDAVGGPLTGIILNAMPDKSKVLVYGSLADAPCSAIGSGNLIFQEKKLEGFWLSESLKNNGFIRTYQSTNLVQSLMKKGDFHTVIRDHVSFDNWKSALLKYQKEMTAGKIILTP